MNSISQTQEAIDNEKAPEQPYELPDGPPYQKELGVLKHYLGNGHHWCKEAKYCFIGPSQFLLRTFLYDLSTLSDGYVSLGWRKVNGRDIEWYAFPLNFLGVSVERVKAVIQQAGCKL